MWYVQLSAICTVEDYTALLYSQSVLLWALYLYGKANYFFKYNAVQFSMQIAKVCLLKLFTTEHVFGVNINFFPLVSLIFH